MYQEYADTASPIIIWQNANRQVQMLVLGNDPQENRRHLLSLLAERDEIWNQDTWIRAWAVVEDALNRNILTAADLAGLLICPNDSICLALWANAEFLLSRNLLKKRDFQENKDHFFAILSVRDETWDESKSSTVVNILDHHLNTGVLTGPDLICLFSCANDPVCFGIWKQAEFLLKAKLLEPAAVVCHKERFLRLISDHISEWEGIHAWKNDDGVWSVITELSNREILTHQDFLALLNGDNDLVCLAFWENAKYTIHYNMVEICDLRQSKSRFIEILAGRTGRVPEYEPYHYGQKIAGGHLIGDLADLGILTAEDAGCISSLLVCDNKDLCLGVWENAYLLIRLGILKKEDFIRNADHFRRLVPVIGFTPDYFPGPDKKFFKFLVEAGVCTLDTLFLMRDAGDAIVSHLAGEAAGEIIREQMIDARIRDLRDDDPAVRF